MMKRKTAMLFGALTTISGWAIAHPGHGLHSANAGWHPMFGVEHVALLAILGGVGWYLARRNKAPGRHNDRQE